MAKKMVFEKEDNLFYVATYTNAGDFSSISEKGYETVGLANASAGIPEGTPSGEVVSDEVEVSSETGKLKAVATESVEISEDGKTVTFEDGSTAPMVTREEEKVAELEAEVLENKPKRTKKA